VDRGQWFGFVGHDVHGQLQIWTVAILTLMRNQSPPTTRHGISKRYAITAAGKHWLETIAVDVDTLKSAKAGAARRCLDWTERRYHLAGPLGGVLMLRFTELGWLRRSPATRAVSVTPLGAAEFVRLLNIDVVGLQQADHENQPGSVATRSQSAA
jgi:hypothetical protein